jgi:hypothetical protein
MSDSKVRGFVHLIEETKTFGQKGFRKRLVVLEQNLGKFTNFIPLDFLGDSCDRADELKMGDEIEAVYRLSGRKWQRDPQSETKYFLSAEAMSFKVLSGASASNSPDAFDDPNDAFSEAASDDSADPPF